MSPDFFVTYLSGRSCLELDLIAIFVLYPQLELLLTKRAALNTVENEVLAEIWGPSNREAVGVVVKRSCVLTDCSLSVPPSPRDLSVQPWSAVWVQLSIDAAAWNGHNCRRLVSDTGCDYLVCPAEAVTGLVDVMSKWRIVKVDAQSDSEILFEPLLMFSVDTKKTVLVDFLHVPRPPTVAAIEYPPHRSLRACVLGLRSA